MKLTKEQEEKVTKFLNNKLDRAFESGKMISMLDELKWINATFEDVNLSARTVRELEKRRAVLEDRLSESSKKIDEFDDKDEGGK